VLLALATLRELYLVTFKGSSLRSLAATQQVEKVTLIAKRGTITDRHGTELAVSEDASPIHANPFLIKDPVGAARELGPILGDTRDDLAVKLGNRKLGFEYLARKVSPHVGARIQRLKIEGVGVMDDSRRRYPGGDLASQVIGTVGIDNKGLLGIEQQLNDKLGGTDGEQRIVKDARGDPVSLEQVRDMHSGTDLRLTLDASLEARTESVLADVGRTFQPKGATAIAMNPNNGDILSMANWPQVDANHVDRAPAWARLNRAVGMTYEPGSTFKAVTVAGALADGVVRPTTQFRVGPQIQVADRVINEAHGTGGVFTVADILARSSNVGAVRIGLRLGAPRFDKWVRHFGFGDLTGVPLPGESAGIVPHVKDYSGSSMGNLPIGQGLAVTPLQMMQGYAAIANGGILVKPRLVLDGKPAQGKRVMSRRNAAQLQKMLEGVLGPTGTAPEAAVPGYDLAGKTGTAQKPEHGVYSQSKYVSSFIGFAPALDAKLLIAVIVDEPGGGVYAGGQVAAPAFERIASYALPYIGIAPK
jgi:cell division protein FtsI (penicillin-binding protein 3)